MFHPRTDAGEKIWNCVRAIEEMASCVCVCVDVRLFVWFRGLEWSTGNNYLLSHKFLINLSQYSELQDLCRCRWCWYCRKCNEHARERKRNKMATNEHTQERAHVYYFLVGRFWFSGHGVGGLEGNSNFCGSGDYNTECMCVIVL